MRFHITAALIAVTAYATGAVADDHTTQATLTLTRTIMRVVETVTATRGASMSVVTTAPSASMPHGNGTYSATLTASSAPVFTGAAVAINVESLGMAAVAGLAAFMAL